VIIVIAIPVAFIFTVAGAVPGSGSARLRALAKLPLCREAHVALS
jgi:hypothetical protein